MQAFRARGPLISGAGLLVAGGVMTATLAAAYVVSAYLVDPVALPLALACVGFVVVTLLRPAWGIAGALLLTPLEVVNVDLLTGAVSPTEAALAVVAAGWVARTVLQPESVARPSQRDLPIIALLAVVALGIIQAVDVAPVLRVLVSWTLFYFLYLQVQTLTDDELRGICAAFLVGAGVLGAIGTFGYFTSGQIGLLAGGNVTLARATGTFQDPNEFGALMALALLPGLALVVAEPKRNAWLVVAALPALTGLVFSLSRGAIVAFAVGALVLLAWRQARWVAAGLAIVFALVTLAGANPLVHSDHLDVVGQRLSTLTNDQFVVSDRPRIWSTAVEVAAENPLLGVGVNQFRYAAATHGLYTHGVPYENVHSIPLSLAAETGLIGLAAFSLLVFQLVRRGVRAVRQSPERVRPLALGLGAALTAFLLQGLTVVHFRTPIVTGVFFILAGAITGLADRTGHGAGAATQA